MTTASRTQQATSQDADAQFWAECRKRALQLNVPAWLIAEQWYTHDMVDRRTDTQ